MFEVQQKSVECERQELRAEKEVVGADVRGAEDKGGGQGAKVRGAEVRAQGQAHV